MTAVVESIRVPVAGGGGVRAGTGHGGGTGKHGGRPARNVPVTEHRRAVCGGAAAAQSPPTPGGHRDALGRVLRRMAADEGAARHVRGSQVRGHRDRCTGSPGSVSTVAGRPQAAAGTVDKAAPGECGTCLHRIRVNPGSRTCQASRLLAVQWFRFRGLAVGSTVVSGGAGSTAGVGLSDRWDSGLPGFR